MSFGACLPRSKYFGNDQFNPSKDRATCQMSQLKLDFAVQISQRLAVFSMTARNGACYVENSAISCHFMNRKSALAV